MKEKLDDTTHVHNMCQIMLSERIKSGISLVLLGSMAVACCVVSGIWNLSNDRIGWAIALFGCCVVNLYTCIDQSKKLVEAIRFKREEQQLYDELMELYPESDESSCDSDIT